MKNFLNWILSVFGYGAYTLVIFVVLLWVLFPTESFRIWLEAKLDEQGSSVAWEIGDIRIGWPLSIVGMDIKAVEMDGEAPLMVVDELKIRPMCWEFLDWIVIGLFHIGLRYSVE